MNSESPDLFLVFTYFLPISALMYQYCLSDITYHSGEVCSSYLCLNGEQK